jgi:small redox-active disulfide protein 2
MEIKILGTGCAKCKNLDRKVRELVDKNNVNATVLYVTDLNEMMEAGIMMTPGLVFDGVVKSVGSIPKDEQILEWMGV